MRFRFRIDGQEHQVDAAADGAVSVDGEAFETTISRPADNRRLVQMGDRTYEVKVVEGETGSEGDAEARVYVLELAGERIPVSVTEVSKTAGRAARGAQLAAATTVAGGVNTADKASAKSPEEVKEGVWAPVPGKVIEIFVKTGDAVEEGDPVLTLEAMKMENELHAPAKGTVTSVLVTKGDQVERGQLLVAFEWGEA